MRLYGNIRSTAYSRDVSGAPRPYGCLATPNERNESSTTCSCNLRFREQSRKQHI